MSNFLRANVNHHPALRQDSLCVAGFCGFSSQGFSKDLRSFEWGVARKLRVAAASD